MSANNEVRQPKSKGALLKRLLTTIVGVAYFLSMCFWGTIPFCLGVTIVAAIGISEFVDAFYRRPQENARAARLSPNDQVRWVNPAIAWLGVLFPAAALVLARVPTAGSLAYASLMAVLVSLFSWRVLRAARTGLALGPRRVVYGAIGCLYIGLLVSSFVLMRGLPGRISVSPFGTADRGAWLMLYAAMCVWATDTFAYFVGRTLGRMPLAPSLSPSKTVEGALGGLLGAVTVGICFGLWIHLPWYHSMIVGGIAGLAGQLGDLFESALKREIGIKDFGRIMPGHGGVLERLDSLLFVIPLAYLYLRCAAGF